MKRRLFRELDLNVDALEGREIYVMQKAKAEGPDLVRLINENPGFIWVAPENVKISTIEECADIIIQRNNIGSVELPLAKGVKRLLKTPRRAKRTASQKKKRN